MSFDPSDRRGNFLAWMAAGKLNASKVAKASGVPYTTIVSLVNGDTASLKGVTEQQIAVAYATTTDVIFAGATPPVVDRRIPIVGYVGAASEFFGIDDHMKGAGLDYIEAPPGAPGDAVAAVVRGDSMHPAIRDGWTLVYWDVREDPRDFVGEECFVRLKDGRTLVKVLEAGAEQGLWTLVSVNGAFPPLRNVEIDWAAIIDLKLRKRDWKPS
jgi:phage repressor protein C with HTH and peptisase S24 domain